MKVSLTWLKDYIAIDMDVEELAEALTMVGLEVESISDRYAYLDSVVAGRIDQVKSHPNADKLTICRVNTKDGDWSVVCGAPNVKEGMLAPLAKPGSVFPDGSQLEKTVIRGVGSEGMLCSEAELGLGIDSSRIQALDSILHQISSREHNDRHQV